MKTSLLQAFVWAAMLMPAMNVGTQVSLAVVIAWGMSRTATGALPIEDLTAFIMYLFYLVSPLVMLFMSLGEIQQGRAAIDRVKDLARIETESTEGAPASTPVTQTPAVEFEDVTFSYSDTTAPELSSASE